MSKLINMVSNKIVIPTPGAVLLGAELLAKGTFAQEGVGELAVIDIGGATTDIHSVLPQLEKLSIEERGLVISNEKQPSYRTVEGNLGMRVSATGIVDTIGALGVLAKIGLKEEQLADQLKEYSRFLEKNPEYISRTPEEKDFDLAMAIGSIEVALKRHAGYLSQEYNPILGVAPGTPVGRDLRPLKYVFAVGGIFTHSAPEKQKYILEQAFKNPGISLLPLCPSFVVDQQYVLYAIGVLAQDYPELTLRFAKKYFNF